MRRLLVCVSAVVGLLASLLAVATAVAGPAGATNHEFQPAVNLSLLGFDPSDAGTQFEITFTPVNGAPAGCTQSAALIFELDAGGVPRLTTQSQSVRLASESGSCAYTPAFPAQVGSFTRTAFSSVEVFESSPNASASYARVVRFDPAISVTLPSPASDYAGTEITVQLTPMPGARSHCAGSESVTLMVAADGTISETTTSQDVRLVASTADGTDPCSFTARFPNQVGSLGISGNAEVTISAASPAAAATYALNTTEFNPGVALSLMQVGIDDVGTELAVTFAPAPGASAGCTQSATVTVAFELGGTASETTASQSVRLVDTAGSATCTYTATFPAAAGRFLLQSAASVPVSAASPTPAANYLGFALFDPQVAPTLPASAQSYSGTEIAVTFTPVAGSHARCTQSTTVTVRVAPDGSVAETPASQSVRLVSTSDGAGALCSYTATFAARAGSLRRITLMPSTVSAASPRAAATFVSDASVFDPTVVLNLTGVSSQDANTQFTMTFTPVAGSHPACTQSASITMFVTSSRGTQEDGPSQNVRLIHVPFTDAPACTYTTAFPADTGRFVRTSAATLEISAASSTLTAAYSAVPRFHPTVSLTLPDPESSFAGTEITVTFAPALGANAQCTQSAEVTWRVDNDGSVVELPASQDVMLVDDVTGGSSQPCVYIATFAPVAGFLRLATNTPIEVSASSRTAAATYTSVATLFDPAIDLDLSFAQADDTGTEVAVTFAPVSGSAAACTQSATVTVRYNGIRTPETPESEGVRLVDDPGSGSCTYTATFPDEAGNFRLTSNPTVQVSASSPTAAVSYTAILPIDPEISLTLPSPATNYAGTEFTVTFAPDDATNTDCTQSAAVTVRVAADGTVSETAESQALRLIFAIGFGDVCEYTATFPATAGVLSLSQTTDAAATNDDPSVAATYTTSSTLFNPNLSVFVSSAGAGDAGTQFPLTIAPVPGAHPLCTQSAVIVLVLSSSGSSSRTPATQGVRLVNSPGAGTTACSYVATYPAVAGRFARSGTTTSTFSAATLSTQLSYAPVASFNPEVSLTLPDPASTYSGTEFQVVFAASTSGGTCTFSETVTVRVGTDGTVTETADSQLVRLVSGASNSDCSYTATFPATVTGLRLMSAAEVTVNKDSTTASATYVSSVTRFDPGATVTLPGVATNHAGTEFVVMLAPMAGAHAACTQTATLTLVVDSNGVVNENTQSAAVRLVDDPGNGANCVYTATFPVQVGRLGLDTNVPILVSAADPVARVTYVRAATTFDPSISITLPTPATDHVGLSFTFVFRPASGSTNPGCTQSAFYTLRVASNGDLEETSTTQALRLIDDPVNGAGNCAYTSSVPTTVGSLRRTSAASVTVSEASPTATATYVAVTRFNPGAMVTLPTPATEFAGTEITVTFAPLEATIEGCTPTATITLEVGADGMTTETTDSQNVELVGDPDTAANSGICSYTATYQAEAGTLRLGSVGRAIVTASTPTAEATYNKVATLFKPVVMITLGPGSTVTVNTDISVTFTPLDDQGGEGGQEQDPLCTQSATVVVQVRPNGDVVESPATRDVMLVDDPGTGSDPCQYMAMINPGTGGLVPTIVPTVPITALRPGFVPTFAAVTRFDPQVRVTVPTPASGYSGTEFVVMLAPTAGSTNPGCSPATTIRLQVATTGDIPELSPGRDVRLVDDPISGVGTCEYTATFPAAAGMLRLSSAATFVVSASTPTATATYAVVTEFEPLFAVTLPAPASNFAGLEFNVPLAPTAGSPAGCTSSATIRLAVATGGSVIKADSGSRLLRLVDDPVVASGDTCAYTATFPASLNRLSLANAAAVEISAADPTARATYNPVTTMFDPVFTVTLPSSASNFAGSEFAVTLAPVSGSSPGCTQSATITLLVASNGDVNENTQGAAVRLVNDPVAGTGGLCVYTATFPDTSGELRRATAAAVEISAGSATAAATYATVTMFDPVVDITLPTPASNFAGTDFAVSFAPTTGSASLDCSNPVTITVEVDPSGNIAENPAGAAVRLVDDPILGSGTCEYTATFPNISRLRLASAAPVVVSGSSATAAATYNPIVTQFDPVISITLPAPESDFAGTEFTVTLAPTTTSTNPGCTQSASITLVVASNGDIAENPAGAAVRLVNDPVAGAGGVCSYTATFPTEVGSLRRTSAATGVVSGTNLAVSATYDVVTEFDPAVDITLPAPALNFAGIEFAVAIAPTSGSAGLDCTDPTTITVRVASNGNLAETPASVAVRLVDDPVVGSGTCSYTATFPDNINRLRLGTAAQVEINAASPTAAATYNPSVTMFDPVVTITVPAPASNFAGAEFAVTFAPTTGSTNPGCTQTATVTVVIASNGDIAENPAGAAVRLVDDPVAGTGGTCSYAATFPAAVGQLSRANAAPVTVNAGSPNAAADYTTTATQFDPVISITLPTPASNFAGAMFTVTLAPTTTSTNPGCTQSTSITLLVDSNGDVNENTQGAAVRLVNDPVAGVGGICAYDATFPAEVAGSLRRSGAATRVVSAANPVVNVAYDPIVTRFDPVVSITLPTPASNFAGSEFAVAFAPAAGSTNPNCTQSATVTVRVDSTGNLAETPASQAVRLVDDPVAGAGGTCAYTATFPAESGVLRRVTAAAVEISAGSATAAATYALVTEFDPAVAITLPAPASNFDGIEFAVTFVPTSGSAGLDCTSSATVTVRVASNGDVSETPSSQSVRLVDDPILGSETCAYTATFSTTSTRLRLASAASVEVSESDPTAAATYEPIITRFDPAVALTLPTPASDFAGTQFAVTFAPTAGSTNPGCTQSATVTVQVASNGDVSETTDSQSVRLVNDPVAGASGTCAYTATFPEEAGQLRRATAAAVEVSASSATASATYALVAEFDPAVVITLPAPASNFAGTEFAVTFVPTSGSAGLDCTDSATVTVRVNGNGNLAETPASQSERLVDDPILGAGTCAYTATFPNDINRLRLATSAAVEVTAASATASATYEPIITRFDPAVAITLPAPASNFDGTEFEVTFTPASSSTNPNCTQSATVTVRVDSNGNIAETPASQSVRLVNDPVAGTGGTCAYTATFPAAVDRLSRADAAVVVVSADSPTAAAAYTTDPTAFTPVISIRLPDPAANFAGAEFTVTFAPTAGSTNPGCTQSASVTLRVASDGTVAETGASQSVRLVNDPVAGTGGACAYTATFPDGSSRLSLATAAEVEVSAASPTASATYDSLVTEFDPVISITLPAPADVYAGTEFAVRFTPIAGSSSLCTPSATVTLRVASNGAVTETTDGQAVRLIDEVDLISGSCSYRATFPATADMLSRMTTAAVTVSAANPRASAVYIEIPPPSPSADFNPAVAITLPNPASAFAGTEFAVEFAPVSGFRNPDCTESATITVRVEADGSVVETEASRTVTLVDNPGTGFGACGYTATFPAEVGVLGRVSRASVGVAGGSPTAAAEYAVLTVDVLVSSTYPDDRIYTTADQATYRIRVDAACAASANLIPSAIGGLEDSATTQVFPGTVLVYVPTVNRQTVPRTRTFTVNAYQGLTTNQPCTVTVTESGGPANCQPVGGDTQTATYSPGLTALTFDFAHSCTDAPDPTAFNPAISIRLPDPASAFASAEFTVTFAPTTGSTNPGCTQSASVTLRVASDGNIAETPASQSVRLVDDPVAGTGGACAYTATFPNNISRLSLATAAEVGVSAASPTASATYDPIITRFDPVISITLPNPASAFAGAEFVVEFAPVAGASPACTESATITVRVEADGSVVETEASRTVTLVDNPSSGSGACGYTATFPAEVGVLGRVSRASVGVAGGSPTAAAVYAVLTVDVLVSSTYPDDRIYTTADQATYRIRVDAACAATANLIPSALGGLEDSATTQVFPGTVMVYVPTVNRQAVPRTRTFTVNAYQGLTTDQPCTVTVTESGGPVNCQPVGGDTQTATYSAGLTALTFDFAHTCTDAPADTGEPQGPDTPPTPPSIEVPVAPKPNTATG